jgi:hypothetical protein
VSESSQSVFKNLLVRTPDIFKQNKKGNPGDKYYIAG